MDNNLIIKNKMESINKIKELGLNKFPEELFKKGQENKVLDFINNYPVKYYAIRDKSKVGGVFKLKVSFEEILDEIKEYNLFTINVSSANYSDNQLLVGEIEILSNNDVYAILSIDSTASVRDAIAKPTFNIKANIFDNKTIDKISYFNVIYNYVVDHNLMDVIVEFALFNKEVGIKGEKVIIYELRTHY